MRNLPKDNTQAENQKLSAGGYNIRRCLFCGQEAELVWVHGHGQCSACGINAEECCRGETCG